MPFAAALSTAADPARALADVCAAASAQLAGRRPDLAVAFFSPHLAGDGSRIAAALAERFDGCPVIGCQGESIVGTNREVELEPALSLWLADFGGAVAVDTFHLHPEDTPDGLSLIGWPDALDDAAAPDSLLLTLADPYTFPLAELFFPLLAELNPGLAVAGGMSSGATGPGQGVLVRDRDAVRTGAVCALLRKTGPGSPRWRTVVSQGCRPIGRPLVVTKARENVILEVGGKPPLKYLQELYAELPAADQELFQRGLHVGLVMSEYRESFGRGDFLVRNLYGIDRDTGAVAITDRVRVGQTVQFQLRDADTADDDLRTLLRADRANQLPPAGALLFTCNGRGTRLFPAPHHDARALAEELGPVPVAGFFAAGELGPVGGTNYVHGFTASAVLFS